MDEGAAGKGVGVNDFDPAKDERDVNTATQDDDRHKADFSDLVGCWIPDPAFDEIIASQRKIDWAKWE